MKNYIVYLIKKLIFKVYCVCDSRLVMSDSLRPHGLYSPWNSPGQHTGVVILSLLQGIFPTQGLNSGLLHCRRILNQLILIPSVSACVHACVCVCVCVCVSVCVCLCKCLSFLHRFSGNNFPRLNQTVKKIYV